MSNADDCWKEWHLGYTLFREIIDEAIIGRWNTGSPESTKNRLDLLLLSRLITRRLKNADETFSLEIVH